VTDPLAVPTTIENGGRLVSTTPLLAEMVSDRSAHAGKESHNSVSACATCAHARRDDSMIVVPGFNEFPPGSRLNEHYYV
jgi:hypothetical protein